jgi:diguanylate cyclase (GGDEF)-like protein
LADQAALARVGASTSEHKLDGAGGRLEIGVTRCPLFAPGTDAPALLLAIWSDHTASRRQDSQLRVALQQLEQQQQANEQLRRESEQAPAAARDQTLGLFQRAQFDDQLRREVDLSAREHRQFSLVSIMLDPLSGAALAAGALGMARVLEALGRLLRSNTRAMDASCHVGESRFAVLLSGVGLATAHSRMEGLRRQCATQIVVLDGVELGFTVSMGVASFPHTASSQEQLVSAADGALQEALRRGGNQVALAGIQFEAG